VKLKFTKMQGLGNDFVVLDGISQKVSLSPSQVRKIADRRFGVGCDQVLMLEPARNAESDFYYRIFNADGGEVEQCGNGARCIARFAYDHGLTAKREMRLQTLGGVITARLEPNQPVTVSMGIPQFDPEDIPFSAARRQSTYVLQVGDEAREFSVLSMGNPHAVQRVDDVDSAPVAEEGPLIEKHPAFPNRVNAGFLQILDRSHARIRVFERGVGETPACGTGACAAAVAGIQLGLLDNAVTMHTRGGDLTVRWQGEGEPLWMSGPAETVFTGKIDIRDEEH
jgi:diaminopimelate epimerase